MITAAKPTETPRGHRLPPVTGFLFVRTSEISSGLDGGNYHARREQDRRGEQRIDSGGHDDSRDGWKEFLAFGCSAMAEFFVQRVSAPQCPSSAISPVHPSPSLRPPRVP
jgi:hypothetical protein